MRRDPLHLRIERPQAVGCQQPHSFPVPMLALWSGLGLETTTMADWRLKGWIGHDVGVMSYLQAWETAELRAVATLVQSGWDERRIGQPLDELPRPLGCADDRLACSLRFDWVGAVHPVAPPDACLQQFDAWIEPLAERGSIDDLVVLGRKVLDQIGRASVHGALVC